MVVYLEWVPIGLGNTSIKRNGVNKGCITKRQILLELPVKTKSPERDPERQVIIIKATEILISRRFGDCFLEN